MFPNGSTPGSATWSTNNGNSDAGELLGHTVTDDVDGRSAPANVTNVLTITNVNISNNGTDYVCAQGLGRNSIVSSTSFLTVLGESVKCFYICIYVCMYVCMCIHICMT